MTENPGSKRIWLSCRVRAYINIPNENGIGIRQLISTEILGCYETKEEAIKRCRQINDFVGPLVVGESLPDEPTDWEGAHYPLREDDYDMSEDDQ